MAAWVAEAEKGGYVLSAAAYSVLRARARLAVWDAAHGWPPCPSVSVSQGIPDSTVKPE